MSQILSYEPDFEAFMGSTGTNVLSLLGKVGGL